MEITNAKTAAKMRWGETYPRPQFKRDSYFSLVGEWDFAVTDKNALPNEYNEKINLPFAPESKLSGIERAIGQNEYMAYRRTVTLPSGFVRNSLILHLGAVDQVCDVYINRTLAMHHEGGYLPFCVDITDLALGDEFVIEVLARDVLSHDYPWGKQRRDRGGMWYTPVSGIWGEVWLESLPESPIRSLKIDQNTERAIIKVDAAPSKKKLTLATGEVYETEGDTFEITPAIPRLWTPEVPYIYDFVIETPTDRVESYFALRTISKIEIDGRERIALNGKPYFFTALLDQGYYDDGIYTPASPEGYKNDILFAKALGFNTLRKHIKIEPLIFYSLCDRLGIVVFQDMVNNGGYSFILDTALPTIGFKRKTFTLRNRNKRTREIFMQHSRDTQDHLYNCPSLCLYTIFNEGWGEFEPDRVFEELSARDTTRLYDATSGWFYERKSDLDSRHIYFRAPKLKRVGKRPVFLSEFGGFSLSCEGHLYGDKCYGYKTFESESELTDAVYSLFVRDTLPLIEEGLCATVYTQLSDVEDEINGLITYDRQKIKVDALKIKEANELLKNELLRVCAK